LVAFHFFFFTASKIAQIKRIHRLLAQSALIEGGLIEAYPPIGLNALCFFFKKEQST